MRQLAHTPYDGSHQPFRIGLKPLDLKNWIEVDDRLDAFLAEKQRLEALYPGRTFMAEADTGAAQAEVLKLLAEHLVTHFPAVYSRSGEAIVVNGRPVRLDSGEPGLKIASKLVQEDLVVLRRNDEGWRLVAGSVAFPSSWSLTEKFGRRLEEIHAPVPGFGAGTRNAAIISRVFDSLQTQLPVWRMNWSVYSDSELFHDNRLAEHLKKRDFEAGIFLRVEYQTLRRLPESGDILFTIRIHVDPFSMLEQHPERQRICENFIGMLQSLDKDQLAYKGLAGQKDMLVARLRALSGRQISGKAVS